MSTAAERIEDMEPVSFTPAIVRHDSILSAMLAPRADHYGEHLKHFAKYAEAHGGEVSFETVRDYFRDLNAAPCAANTKRIRRQAVKASGLMASPPWRSR